MIKILAIGNSFSQDALAYLYDIAQAGGIEIKAVNLYIGGCPLERHWENIEADAALYDYELNGQTTDRKVSIKEILMEEQWDFITLQQASHDSGILESYYPYANKVSSYVKEYVPDATQLIHQTWAYEIDSDHPEFTRYQLDQNLMYQSLTKAYATIAEELSLKIIPTGKVIQSLRGLPIFDYANGGISLCRDGFHLNLVYGRYAAAATWYEFILNQNILDNSYIPPIVDNVTASEEEMMLIKNMVHDIVRQSK